MIRIAVLDDYQRAALTWADWQSLHPDAQIEAIPEHIADEDALAKRLHACDGVVLMRERTAFPRSLIAKLPNLQLIITAGMRNAAIDMAAAAERNITVCGTEMLPYPTAELTWGLILALFRHIPAEDTAIRQGRWQTTTGNALQGKTLGILGLGRLGSQVAAVGNAFGMEVIAWSQNLTDERAEHHGAVKVSKEELFSRSDVVSLHVVLSPRSRGIVGTAELALMKRSAYLVNTSRGPLVDEAALLDCLRAKRIAGAGIDVYDVEPIPKGHPLLALDNTVLTPHLGYTCDEAYRLVYGQAVDAIRGFIDGKPIRVITQ